MGSVARSPLQGGLPAPEGLSGAVVEIACDESGFSGTNMLDAATPVFTHASVDLSVDEAVAIIAELSAGSRWSLAELKSGQLSRRPQAGEAWRWLLEELRGRAHVQVVDKELFLVTRIVDLFLHEPTYAAGTRLTGGQRPAALALYLAGRQCGPDWDTFLATFAALVRVKGRHHLDRAAVKRFFLARDVLAAVGLGADVDRTLDQLGWTRVWTVLTRMAHDDRSIPPPLEPLLPALAETVLSWSDGDRRVLVVHDEQSALTADRLRRLQETLRDGSGTAHTRSPLAGLVTVDSREDPRVQVADLLAGVARRSSDIGGDDLLAPFLSTTSLRGARDR